MKILSIPLSILLILLTACGGDTAPSDATDASASDATRAADSAESDTADSAGLCVESGPQTPRDISLKAGLNTADFPLAPPATEMNLCNIHAHLNAEHKGPGFSVFVDDTDHGGYACNETADLTEAELAPAPGAYQGIEPGDTIEVHWVHTTCETTPGPNLDPCAPENCADRLLRVEAQVFLVVNDPNALDFTTMVYGDGNIVNGRHQARMIPADTGTPVVFRGSTTGPSFTQEKCSPLEVTWSVRPRCAKLDIGSLHRWVENENVFGERTSHGVRQLVTAPELLSPIE